MRPRFLQVVLLFLRQHAITKLLAAAAKGDGEMSTKQTVHENVPLPSLPTFYHTNTAFHPLPQP